MRIVVLGDFHMHADQLDLTEAAMEDVAACRPDLVIPLGDFGGSGKIGRVAGLDQAKEYLDKIGAPLRPILGNHDIEREAGDGPQPQGTMERAFLERFGLESAYGFWEEDAFRLLFASTDPQPADSCYQVQECYVSEQQFAALQAGLAARPGVPVIAFTHAPPLGARLRTVPAVHVRATNAYLDQNHDPHRWLRLCEDHPEIIAWFAAHYHLGHVYPDAQTEVHGTRFFLTGVHGSATRDGRRQSRVIDIAGDEIHVWTLDHVARQLTEEGSWRGSLRAASRRPKAVPKLPEGPAQRPGVPVGDAPVRPRQLAGLPSGRVLAGTDDGFAWEVDIAAGGVLGTLHLDETPLSALAVGEDGAWLAFGAEVRRVDLADPWRFVRDKRRARPAPDAVLPTDIDALCARPGGGAFAAAGSVVWEIDGFDGEPRPTLELPSPVVEMAAGAGRLWLRDAAHALWVWDGKGDAERQQQGVIAFDASAEGHVQLSLREDAPHLTFEGVGGGWHYILRATGSLQAEVGRVHVVYLGGDCVAVTVGGSVGVADRRGYRWLPTRAPATAIARGGRASGEAAADLLVALEGQGEWGRPQVQKWAAPS